jgi:hypothetical protein
MVEPIDCKRQAGLVQHAHDHTAFRPLTRPKKVTALMYNVTSTYSYPIWYGMVPYKYGVHFTMEYFLLVR